MVQLLSCALWALIYLNVWDNGKKRKIGLSLLGLMSLFLTPIIAAIIAWCCPYIEKGNKKPSVEQRLKYETPVLEIAVGCFQVLVLGVLFPFVRIPLYGATPTLLTIVGCNVAMGVGLIKDGINIYKEKKKRRA